MKRLTKSTSDRRVAGVCGGIAQYLNVDSTWVRLVFVLLLFGQIGIPAYILLSIVMPYDYEERRRSIHRNQEHSHQAPVRKDVTPREEDWSDF